MFRSPSRAASLAAPRVLLVCDSTEPSGVAQHMVTLAETLGRRIRPLLVFAGTPGGLAAASAAQAKEIASCTLPAQALADGDARFHALLRHFMPDVVHVHAGIGWEGHGAASGARSSGGHAVVRTEHLPYTLRPLNNPPLEAAYARGVESVDRIICVCRAARKTFLMSGVEPERFTVVYNGVGPRPATRTRAEVRAGLGLGAAQVILTVARFTGQKRHITLVEALPRLLRSQPDACLLWAGTGPLEPGLRARARELRVDHRIILLGSRRDIPDLMVAADVFCLPSYFEGHPLVVLEAMGAGLPVVAARSLGITEAVHDGETGLLYPFDHAPLLAHALGRVLADPGLARCLAGAGKEMAGAVFTAERMARETLDVYHAVLRKDVPRTRALLGRVSNG